jgi:hypothetical protein
LSKTELIRLAIAQFSATGPGVAKPAEIDIALTPFNGVLTPVRRIAPAPASRVRRGKTYTIRTI